MTTTSQRIPRDAPDVPARVRRIVVVAVAVLTGLGLLGTALSPYLLVEHPLLLIGINPDSRHLVLAANRVDLWQAVAVGAARRWVNFMGTFALASLYGYQLVGWLEEKRAWVKSLIAFVEKLYAKVGLWLVVFVPLYWVAVFAGITRLSWKKFALAIIPGQIAFVLAFLRFGEAIDDWTAPLIAFVSAHPWETTMAATALVVAQQVWSRWRKRRAGTDKASLPQM